MSELFHLKKLLNQFADKTKALNFKRFFKNSQDKIFLGVSSAQIKKIAKDFHQINLQDVLQLMKSNIHDERSLALAVLCFKFKKGDEKEQETIFRFYIRNKKYLSDWDSVDDSAPYIAGPYLLMRDKKILYEFARSKRIWDRRIAIIATLYFIRHDNIIDTLQIAEILIHDKEDLIHKAVGWALREVGKKDKSALKQFLKEYQHIMPRTMLRYAIERFSGEERKKYLKKKNIG